MAVGGEMFDLVGAALALRSAQIIALQAALLQQRLSRCKQRSYGVNTSRTVICFDKQALFLGFGSGDAT